MFMVISLSCVSRSDLPSQLDRDVAVAVQHGSCAGRYDARCVVLLDDAWAFARRGKIGAIEDRCLAPAETRAEVHAARWRVSAARPIGSDRFRNARPIRNSLGDHAETDDLDRLVRPRAMPVGPLVLLTE